MKELAQFGSKMKSWEKSGGIVDLLFVSASTLPLCMAGVPIVRV